MGPSPGDGEQCLGRLAQGLNSIVQSLSCHPCKVEVVNTCVATPHFLEYYVAHCLGSHLGLIQCEVLLKD